LISISDDTSGGELTLSFADGATATTSAVIACDGIKSVARSNYVFSDTSNANLLRPSFANEFAYRGMYSREEFLSITGGAFNAGKGTLFCGPNSYVVMYPVEKGSL
jgi:salicylate hydroxylase